MGRIHGGHWGLDHWHRHFMSISRFDYFWKTRGERDPRYLISAVENRERCISEAPLLGIYSTFVHRRSLILVRARRARAAGRFRGEPRISSGAYTYKT